MKQFSFGSMKGQMLRLETSSDRFMIWGAQPEQRHSMNRFAEKLGLSSKTFDDDQ